MRKVYILRADEEDGTLADALLAQGLEPNEEDFANSECPRCGEATVLIYTEGGESRVLTCSTEDLGDEGAEADGWFMACGSPACSWEEPVERVLTAVGAEIFDLSSSSVYLDEEVGLTSGNADWFTRLESWFEGLLVGAPTLKLQCYLEEVRYGRDWILEHVRAWLSRVPAGRRVHISTGAESFQGKFVAHTDQGCLILAEPTGELIAFPVTAIAATGPDTFPPEPAEEQPRRQTTPGRFVLCLGQRERVVAQGHELDLRYVDRFGLYHVTSRDPAAALALGLQLSGENLWTGRLRRTQIEAHFEVERKVRVRGHWLQIVGKYTDGGLAVRTWDPGVAAELGFQPKYAPAAEAAAVLYGWDGEVPPDLVEAEDEVRQDLW